MDNCKSLKINITGDLVINQNYQTSNLDDKLINFFKDADYNIVNLEAPVTSSMTKILKTGPHLKANEQSTLNVLKKLNTNVVTLANNHILDYDEQGVFDTISFCNANDIQYVGAGLNKSDAAKILSLNTCQGSIAIVNIAENEWASATDNSAGGNGMDLIENSSQITNAKDHHDFVFVIVHGGHEYYNLPSPRMQKQYRFYVDCGADIVVGHHTHCIGGNEIYKGSPIYYSLGNFLFTKKNVNSDWYLGLILSIEITGKKLYCSLNSVKQTKEGYELAFLAGKEAREIENRILDYNKIIANKLLLDKQWDRYVNAKYTHYLDLWSPSSFITNRYIRAIFRKFKGGFLNKNGFSYFLNLMKCEAHSDLSKDVINKFLKNEGSHTS